MKNLIRKSMICLICIGILFSMAIPAMAAENAALEKAVEETAAYMVNAVTDPRCANIGGEWAVLGLARSGFSVPEGYFEDYYASVESYVKACDGVLHTKKYTEYSRVILALTAIGKDPSNVGGYDLLKPLGDFEKTVWQGLNGPIWALIALDSGSYEMPADPEVNVQATRELYVQEILDHQLADGGFALGGTGGGSMAADPDMTGMALQALAKYTNRKDVSEAVERALSCLSNLQDEKGGYASWGTTNSESCVQVLVALCELGIDLNDARFVKNGFTLLDNLLTFRKADGGFVHILSGDSGNNQMSTEQGFYGLVAALRAMSGKNSLYRMGDAIAIGAGSANERGTGLPGKHADVRKLSVINAGISFSDVAYEDNITAVEALAARGVINGIGDGKFAPRKTMTRAEFAAIVVRGLGLTPKANGKFRDVAPDSWYAAYVGTANSYGIVNGISDTEFNPDGTITRQEAAAMVARAAKLCGMDTELTASATRDMLAQFGDYTTVAGWARQTMAFCYQTDILDQSDLDIEPERAILRCEIAQMLYNLLIKSNLM